MNRIKTLCLGVSTILLLSGCTVLKDKTVAIESKVYGIDMEVPSVNGSGSSFAKLRLGVIITRFADAPEGGKVDMSTQYNDISMWSGTGSGTTTFKIEGPTKSAANREK